MLHLHKSKNGQYYFTFRSEGNGKTIVTSETYTRRAYAIKGMKALILGMTGKPAGKDHPIKCGNFYFLVLSKGYRIRYF